MFSSFHEFHFSHNCCRSSHVFFCVVSYSNITNLLTRHVWSLFIHLFPQFLAYLGINSSVYAVSWLCRRNPGPAWEKEVKTPSCVGVFPLVLIGMHRSGHQNRTIFSPVILINRNRKVKFLHAVNTDMKCLEFK